MSSILTNNSAMVALQTLQSINKDLAMTQNEISTGKSISSARENAAIWSISQVMQSDVDGFDAISDSLALGESTVAVGRNAAESVTSLLNQIKDKIVNSQEAGFDRETLQDDVASLTAQIEGIVSAAQFNGQNLLSNKDTAATYADIVADVDGSGEISILSSLDRSSDGSVASSFINVAKQDLGTEDGTAGGLTLATAALTADAATVADGATAGYNIVGETATADRNAAVMAGDGYEFDMTTVGGTGSVTYIARDGDTASDVAAGLAARAEFAVKEQGITGVSFSSDGANFNLTNNTGANIATVAGDFTLSGGGTAGGGLELLGDIDVSTEDGAAAALSAIEGLIQTSINAAAEFGTGEKRLEIQAEFVSKLTDSLKSGIGALIDADMEEASARLQALQVQQQLGIQSLSIANQAPQQLLSLFR
ncbi:MAG: flagellin [Pseudomonadota bacterium]